MKELVLISRHGSQHQEERLLELAEWMGISTRMLTIGDPPALDQLINELGDGERSGVMSAETLTFLRQHSPPRMLQAFIENGFAKLLVVNVGASQVHQDAFDWLTGGAVAGLASSHRRQAFRMPESGRRCSGAFADQSFTVGRPTPVHTFDLKDPGRGNVEKLLLADERPVFLRQQRGPCEVFLLAVTQLPDIREQLCESRGVEEHYDRLIPLLIFLRHCFGESCWHGVATTARLIIDDPLLNPAYGFLNYGALDKSMRSVDYGTTIAFIPWNYWRTSKRKASSIFDQAPNLSICVHGCDHTNREFEDQNLAVLQGMADTGLDRMQRHERRTGVAFDPVMVFPQGKFSTAAMSALRTGGYLAAVNTSCFPGGGEAEPLTIADFLRPAITKFHGFPLFQRRYPRRLIDSAFDIFLGRPALLVQHAEDFRDGYRQLEEYVGGLRKLEPTLTWGPLTDQLRTTCMTAGSVDRRSKRVRFFTRHFRFTNRQSSNLMLSKEEPDPSRVSAVLVNGTRVPFAVDKGLLTFEHRADAGQLVDVRILDRPRSPARVSGRAGVAHTVSVGVRRGLSEFRDNALARHPRLLTIAKELARRMKVTGTAHTEERA